MTSSTPPVAHPGSRGRSQGVDLRRQLWLVWVPRAVLLVLTGAVLLVTAPPWSAAATAGLGAGTGVAPVVLLAALVVGTPHGASDVMHLGRSPRRVAVVGGLYVAAAGAAVVSWLLAPFVVLLALLVLAAVHFGGGDLEVLEHLHPAAAPGRAFRAVGAVALGGIPVAVPIGLHGRAVGTVLDELSGGRGSTVVACCQWALPVVVACALVATCSARWRTHVGPDLLVLGLLFLLLTPLVAFAAYFAFWHAWRQSGLQLGDAAREWGVSPQRAGCILLAAAAMPTALVVGAALVLAGSVGAGLVTGLLVTVLCLTVPHAGLAAHRDRARARHRMATGTTTRQPGLLSG